MDRDAAVDRLEAIVKTVESDPLPVPVCELWTYGDVALGLDPIDRLDVYLTKDVRLRDDDPDRIESMTDRYGVEGLGRTVSADWAEQFPEHVRTADSGHVAPAKCLAAHLLEADEPVHLEVCNTGFESNVTQRLEGARARENYEQLIDPRGVCLWVEGRRSPGAFDRLRSGEYTFPPLAGALEMLGMDADEAETASGAVSEYRRRQDGVSLRSDVV